LWTTHNNMSLYSTVKKGFLSLLKSVFQYSVSWNSSSQIVLRSKLKTVVTIFVISSRERERQDGRWSSSSSRLFCIPDALSHNRAMIRKLIKNWKIMKSRDRICFFIWDLIKVKHQPLMATSGTIQPSRSGNGRGDSPFCLTRVSVSNPNWNGDTATRRPMIRHNSTWIWIVCRNMNQHQVSFRFLFQKVVDMVENSWWKKRDNIN